MSRVGEQLKFRMHAAYVARHRREAKPNTWRNIASHSRFLFCVSGLITASQDRCQSNMNTNRENVWIGDDKMTEGTSLTVDVLWQLPVNFIPAHNDNLLERNRGLTYFLFTCRLHNTHELGLGQIQFTDHPVRVPLKSRQHRKF